MEKKTRGHPKGAKSQDSLGKVCHSSRRCHSLASSSQRTDTSPKRTTRSKSQPEASVPAKMTPKTKYVNRKDIYIYLIKMIEH